MNIQEEIKKLEAEFNVKIRELKKRAEQQEDEFPQFGDDYWSVDSDTEVMDTASYNGEYDQGRLSIGNVFRTKEEVEFAVEKLKVEAELRKFSSPFKGNNKNYCIELCSPYERVTLYSYEQFQIQGVIYFESREKAQQAVYAVGAERIKKYIFGVEAE